MLIFEFVDDDPLRVKLVAVTSQLKARFLDTKSKSNMSTDAFLSLLKHNDVIIDREDLFDLVKKEPLKNIIANISGSRVIFKGQAGTEEPKSDSDAKAEEDTVAQMAKRAAKR